MSMNAVFVQVEDAEIAGFEAEPDSVEALFASQAVPTAGMFNLAGAMQKRLKLGPQALADRLAQMPEPLRQQFEGGMARTASALNDGRGGDLMKLLQQHLERRGNGGGGKRESLSLDKAWHGVHYLLAGTTEPGPDLRSQAVLGGVELGDDPEGFAGYGPARYFRAAQVRALSQELGRPEVEREAAVRFDPAKMTQLQIYPGWQAGEQDRDWVMDAFRRLREFYSRAAANGRAIVTCLV